MVVAGLEGELGGDAGADMDLGAVVKAAAPSMSPRGRGELGDLALHGGELGRVVGGAGLGQGEPAGAG